MSEGTIIMSTEHRAQSQPVVSFCIPVYNNAEAAVKIVQSLLVSDDSRFEVVVSDDASSDGAQELLSQIHDPRFKYVRNDQNLGAHKNWCHVMELSIGEWLYLVMGRDRLYGEHIGKLIDYLDYAQKNGITCLRDGHSFKQGVQRYSGIDAMIKFLGNSHPTGSVFNGKIFRDISDSERQRYFTSSDMYPENYVWRDMLLKGSGAMVMSGVFISYGMVEALGVVIDKSKVKSTVECGLDIKKTFFAPSRRMKLFTELVSMVAVEQSDKFRHDKITRYLISKFYNLLRDVSYCWSFWCEDKDQMAHYGHSTRRVSILEMWKNIFVAYRNAADYMTSEGLMTSGRKMRMLLEIPRMCIYSPIASQLRRILISLGLWHKVRKFVKSSRFVR